MTDEQMREWKRLHGRVTSGDTLSADERTFYEGVIAEWDTAEEKANAESLRQTRERLAAMEAEYARLRARHEELNAQITAVEEALETRRLAAVSSSAAS